MLLERPFWQKKIEEAWSERSIIWLMGVRRIGKTSLCKSIENIEYFDCELPRTRQLFDDIEGFLQSRKGKRIALDEIHRLENPSELLKIAADYYPDTQVIATGSSTLGASKKFKDTLTGRKREIWLTPLLLQEMEIFGNTDLRHRFLFGGFPSFFVKKELPERDFQEWGDAFWAKDIQELFSVAKRYSFQKFTELLLANSGGIFEASRYTGPCEVSRPTIANYLTILEETFVVHIVRPFSTHRPTELVMAPKIYGFDTGFVSFAKGRKELRQEDLGLMWEQCVLNEMHGKLQTRNIHYWRDKRGREIDFVFKNRNGLLTAIECKYTTTSADSLSELKKNFAAFRHFYPEGNNIIVASNIERSFVKEFGDISITYVNPTQLIEYLQ